MLKSKREMILVWIAVEAVGVKKSKRTWCKTGKEKQKKKCHIMVSRCRRWGRQSQE